MTFKNVTARNKMTKQSINRMDCRAVVRLLAMTFVLLAALITTPVISHAQDCGTPTTNGLVGYWQFNETTGTSVADSSGNGLTAAMLNGMDASSATERGVVGNSFRFAGAASDDEVSVTNVALDTEVLTFSAWIRDFAPTCTGVSEFNCWGIARKIAGNPPNSTAMNGWFLDNRYGSAELMFYNADTTSFSLTTGSNTIDDGLWHHVAFTRDASNNVNLYLDGTLVDSGVDTYTLTNTQPLRIGSSLSGVDGGRNFDGNIDEVRFYNRVLSAEEIAQLYEYGLGDEGAMVFDERHASMKYCNGTDWVHAGLGPYVPNAVTFDGTNDYLLRGGALTGTNDTKLFSGSLWFRRNTTGGTQLLVEAADGAFKVQLDPSGEIFVSAENASGTGILANYNLTWIDDTDWHHLVFSFDMSDSNKRHIYVDDVSDITAPDIYIDDFIYATVAETAIGGGQTGALKFSGDLADLWMDMGTYIDLSIESNRRKFISASGMPMYLGEDGSLPTGAAPDIFLTGDTENWHTNKGTGGGFTENGALTYSSSRPGQSASLPGSGYFVEGPEVDGNMGGISGAAALCLSTLQSSAWLNKAAAVANGQLTNSNVRPWLCTTTECQNLVADATYAYASVSNPTRGGATMTASAEGYTEDDGLAYEDNTAFGNDNGFRRFYTGRGVENQTPYTTTCSDWTSNSSGISTTNTPSDVSYYPEKLGVTVDTCDQTIRLICLVDPPGCGASGAMKYNADFNVMEYCNGTEWISMGPIGGTPPTDGLVGHWELDETSGTSLADATGNGHNGTFEGGIDVQSANGIVSTAIRFDAVDDRVVVPDNNALDITDAITISGWVMPESLSSGGEENRIVTKGTGGYSSALYTLDIRDDLPILQMHNYLATGPTSCDEATETCAYGVTTIPINKWSHIAASYDGSVAKIYVNGIEDGSNSFASTGAANASDVYIGSRQSDQDMFDGLIDDLRIYDRALSEQEIQQLYYYGLSNGLGDVDNGCASPAANEGEMIYNADFNVMQYCNGEQWIGLGQ